ncbi:MAG TPA: hypothetical protein HA327_04115 [Candidatus Poseidoniaceae archaeon]|nr:MAG TPA: hypothetical protein D7H81_04055 [Candidatus Poseidoniales archaeon]HII45204.1 hypothetical protein [Candidatus Poseidoniaceae archaeon]
MPGSPYFDGTPKGLLTWPKLLKIGLPMMSIVILIGWRYDILIEILLCISIALMFVSVLRK